MVYRCDKLKTDAGRRAVIRINRTKTIGSALVVLCTFLIGSVAAQPQSTETDAVKAANQAFYSAFSARDVAAMQKIWSSDADIQNIGPTSKSVTVRWDKIGKGFESVFIAFPELKATMEPEIKIVDVVAWVTGIEQIQRKDKAGAISNAGNLVTNIFQKQDGHWVMVHHHASRLPQ
jgi:ketosteroid isomerase-like protein